MTTHSFTQVLPLRLWSLLLVASWATVASATTIVLPNDEQLIRKTPVIVIGRVEKSKAVERSGGIWTETILTVEKTLKGAPAARVVIREVGGRVGDRVTKVWGSPEYVAGERVLAFLVPTVRGDFQTQDLFVGKFTERRTRDGQRIWHRPESSLNTMLLDKDFQPLVKDNDQRDAQGFEAYISARGAGLAGDPRYGVANPIYERAIAPNFSMIDEPNIYRWFAFERGSSASWTSFGAQAGYPGGGINELQTGVAAWSTLSQSKIRYQYGGSSTSAAGGLVQRNGLNDVVFGDLTNEIAGSWSPSTGGVVGRGGFNDARAAGSWTSGYNAGETHPLRTYQGVQEILEGNLVIQDGVSPAAGISSSSLAEIISHELGHTLGFGHSADPSALMYYQVTGIGSQLRTDDVNGARWLYPTNISSPNAPNPPSNLQGALVDTNQLQLNWTDNSSNETSFGVYLAIVGSNPTLIGTVGANVTSVLITNLTVGQSYVAEVTARNADGESARSNSVEVRVVNQLVTAAFGFTPGGGTAGVTLFRFFDQSTGPVVSRTWDFADGTQSTDSNPTHVFQTPGSYTVSLTVRNSAGDTSSSSRLITITPVPGAVNAAFSFTPASATTDDEITFTDESIGPVISWDWLFGDGTSSGERNPRKKYATPGAYDVVLRVGSTSQSSQATRTLTVAAGNPASGPVTAEFELSTNAVGVNQKVTFFDRSGGAPTSWYWNFGDGSASTFQNPAHIYTAPGTYEVTLTAGNSTASSTKVRSISVSVNPEKFRSLIPVSARTGGAGGSSWRTELTIFNGSDTAITLRLAYVPAAGAAPASRTLTVGAQSTVAFENALGDLFSLAEGGGAITIDCETDVTPSSIRVSSRTFTTSSGGTYGQFVPDLTSRSVPSVLYLTGIESSASYRTNLGFVNSSASAVNVTAELFDSNGSLASASLSIGATTFQQAPITSLFPILQTTNKSSMSIKIRSGAPNAINAYASVVDNRSNDPIFIAAVDSPLRGGGLIIPVVGRTSGAGATFWRSDLTAFNPGSSSMSLTLKYLPAGQDNRGAPARNLALLAGQTVTLSDVLASFGLESGGGSLQIGWTGGTLGPVITSRTYTSRGDGGTYGQSIAPSEIRRFTNEAVVTGLRSDASYRTNLGFLNGGDRPLVVDAALVSASGQEIARTSVNLKPLSLIQGSLADLFPALGSSSPGKFTLVATTQGSATLFAYGSVVDNTSGDPIFVPGE